MPGLRTALLVSAVAGAALGTLFIVADLSVPALYGLMSVVLLAIIAWWDRRYHERAPNR